MRADMSGEPCIHEMVGFARLDGESEKRAQKKTNANATSVQRLQLESQNRYSGRSSIESRGHDATPGGKKIVAVRGTDQLFQWYDASLDVGHQENIAPEWSRVFRWRRKGHQADGSAQSIGPRLNDNIAEVK